MEKYTFCTHDKNALTIVAVRQSNGDYNIGITRLGDHQKYNQELGEEIAENRAAIQPFCSGITIPNETVFNEIICPVIVSSQRNLRQSNLQNYYVNKDARKNKKAVVVEAPAKIEAAYNEEEQ